MSGYLGAMSESLLHAEMAFVGAVRCPPRG